MLNNQIDEKAEKGYRTKIITLLIGKDLWDKTQNNHEHTRNYLGGYND